MIRMIAKVTTLYLVEYSKGMERQSKDLKCKLGFGIG